MYLRFTCQNNIRSHVVEEGVEFYFVDGDACTLALMAVAHKTALGKHSVLSLIKLM